MKTVRLFLVLMTAVCVIGCENRELVTCQQEKGTLQAELDQANAAVAVKDKQIEALKTENTEMQTKAMESITIMMQKQAEKDKQLKGTLAKSQQETKDLKSQISKMEVELQNKRTLLEEMKNALQTVEQEKQDLVKKINESQEPTTP